MNNLVLQPLTQAHGKLVLPGSKSISNRVLLLAALAQGRTLVRALLDSDDTRVMLAALKALGVAWQRIEVDGKNTDDYWVEGVGGNFPNKHAKLFMGNAGTAIRPLTAALALQQGSYQVSGVPRMHERPIGDLIDGLRQIGAVIDYTGNDGYPPLHIQPAQIGVEAPIKVRGDVSSQFLTALLLNLPRVHSASGKIVIDVVGELISKPYIEITLNLLARFGVQIEREGWQRFVLPAGVEYQSPGEIYVEGDASSASYFLAAGALGGGPLRIEGVGASSIQGDVKFADALALMGANITQGDNCLEVAGWHTPDQRPKAITLDCNHIPDAAMTLAVVALFAEGVTTLTNIASWRVKETDRIAAVATELRKVGATVLEREDYIRITPPATLADWRSPAEGINTYDDHRMAMCFALAAFGPLPIRINEPECVAKTFPDFFAEFAKVTA